MLSNDLFYVGQVEQEGAVVKAMVTLNAGHKIFEGHFPGQPVLPGVCMLQMIKEILESVTGSALQLSSSDHIKFLSMIDPRTTPGLQVTIQYQSAGGTIQTISSLVSGATTFFKMKAGFAVVLAT